MRNRLFIIGIIFLFFQTSIRASVDSLQQILPEQSGKEKLQTYQVLAGELFEQKLVDSAQTILNQALKSGSDLFPVEKIELLLLQGDFFEKSFAFEKAIESWELALKIAEGEKLKERVGGLCLKLGRIFLEKNDSKSAVDYFKKGLNAFKENGDESGMANANKQLGLLMLSQKNMSEAEIYLGETVKLNAQTGNLKEAADGARALGIALQNEKLFESSLQWLSMSLNLNRKLNRKSEFGEDFRLVTSSYLKKSDYSEALMNNQQALQIFLKTDEKSKEAEALLNFTEIFFNTEKEEQGKKRLTEAAEKINELKTGQPKADLLKRTADFYSSINDFENSYLLQNQVIKIQNEIFENEKSLTVEELTTKYESQISATDRQRKLDLIESEKTALSRNKMLWIALLLLATAMAGSLFYLKKNHQKDRLILNEKTEEVEESRTKLESKNVGLELLNRQLLEEISEREELEKASFERDRFLATMTHRMGTPLNSVVGLTHLLLNENPRPDQREQLRTLQFAANSLVVFINDVLDFSKIEAGKLKPDTDEIRMRRLYNDLREQAELETSEKDLKINFSYDNRIPHTASGDAARLNQIFTNLLSTSLKSTVSGEISVEFGVGEETEEHVMFFASVSDTGTPLAPDIVARIFGSPDQYYLLGKQNSVAFAMTMARRLIELQGGKFELFVNENHGNFFRFWLPLEKRDQPLAFSTAETTTLQERLSGHKILLVEDNQINQMVVARILSNLGMQIITANNGLEALDMMKMHNFDLILMDIQMPEMDGYRATAAIRKMSDPVKKTTPIIALTASAFLTDKDKSGLFGMNDHVGKPFSPDELLQKIDKLLLSVKKQS